jgi:tetratricopeptide (TPR) repeat protein
LDPKCLYAHINLGGVLQALGDLQGNLNSALSAVSIDPTSALAFNNLGSALTDLAMFHEAKHAYETAQMLQPNQVDTLINLAAVEAKLGSSERAIEMYEKTLRLLPAREKHRREAVQFFASFEYLKSGNLAKGWDYYDGGFSPMVPLAGARTPKRVFDVPRWRGEPLQGKRLLVWREQGLGDEILFGSCLPDLRSLGAERIIVECDPRLVPTFQRSFPEFMVRSQIYYSNNFRSPNNDYDYEIPLGSLMRQFRRSISDFGRSGPYLKADPSLVEEFEERLKPHRDLPLIGICWRSGKLSPVRNLSYTVLEDWLPVLQSDKFRVVSLQYGDADAEIDEIKSKFAVDIVHWGDLDQKNELDKVFALMTCLDLVVSVNTAPLRMAAAIGAPVLSVEKRGWARLGEGSNASKWFPNHHFIEPDESGKFESRMSEVVKVITKSLCIL